MRRAFCLACVTGLTVLWPLVLEAAQAPKGVDAKDPAKRLEKARKSAPALSAVPDKAKKAALLDQAQKVQAQWAKQAAASAAKAAGESARAISEVSVLRKEIAQMRAELAKRDTADRAAKATVVVTSTSSRVAQPAPEAKVTVQVKAKQATKALPTAPAAKAKAAAAATRPAASKASVKPMKAAAKVVPVDLSKHFNNDGITYRDNRRDSDFDQFRQSYAAELLPEPGPVKPLPSKPDLVFVFPPKKDGAKNNVAAMGQRIPVPQGSYTKLYVLGAAVFGAQVGELKLVYGKNEHAVTLKLSDWCAASKFGEARVYSMTHRRNWKGEDEKAECSLWVQTIDVSPTEALTAIVLPNKPMMHVFAMTLAAVR